jgi:hypothetical protein
MKAEKEEENGILLHELHMAQKAGSSEVMSEYLRGAEVWGSHPVDNWYAVLSALGCYIINLVPTEYHHGAASSVSSRRFAPPVAAPRILMHRFREECKAF